MLIVKSRISVLLGGEKRQSFGFNVCQILSSIVTGFISMRCFNSLDRRLCVPIGVMWRKAVTIHI